MIVEGSGYGDYITVQVDASGLGRVDFSTLDDAGSPVGEGSFSLTGVELKKVIASGGNDDIVDPGGGSTLLGGDGDDTIVIADTFGIGVFADGGAGSDSYVVYFGSLLGPVTIADSGAQGDDSLTAYTPGSDPVVVTSSGITQGVQTVTLASPVESLALNASSGTALPSVTGAAVEVRDPSDPSLTALLVGGTAGADAITLNPGHQGSGVKVVLNNTPVGTFNPTGRIIVYGKAGNDDIQVSGSISLPAELYGGPGNDRLKGGAGHDRVFGEVGDDLLVGGAGRDLLVGGLGADRIDGNADDDIIISGTTAFDADRAALNLIMAEWTSDRDYATRTANLKGNGTGTRANGSTFLQADVTVLDDNAADVLTGNSGQDWFFANLDTGVKDKITDLNAAEFANDLDWINSGL